ncbi:MAG: class I SAM-dependent methyltransferase [Solirubrobacteraceae bacterium]
MIASPHPRAPLAVGWALRRTRELIDRMPRAGRRMLTEAGADPLPPRRLRARAGAPGATEYLAGGRRAAQELADGLRSTGRDPERLRSVLDFGCGAGRVLPHIARLCPGAHCVGCDVDRAAVEWAGAHRPAGDWFVSSFEPPLPFAPERFDLVYSVSVFSHLGRGLQERWLRELRRILAPGGVALLSVHGASAFEAFRTGQVRSSWCSAEVFAREPLRTRDFVFTPYVRSLWTAGELPGVGSEYGLAFHGHDYLREVWGRQLNVVDIRARAVTGWQDLVVCTR